MKVHNPKHPRRERVSRVCSRKMQIVTVAATIVLVIVIYVLTRDDYLPAIYDPFVRKEPFPYGQCEGLEQSPEFLFAKALQRRCVMEYADRTAKDRELLLSMNKNSMTADQLRERDDALYFGGVPSYMRKDTVYAQSRKTFVAEPSNAVGKNLNVEPDSQCFALDVHKTDYQKLRPHIFSRDVWGSWYKEIGLDKIPVTLKGPSRPQSFGGRRAAVRTISSDVARAHEAMKDEGGYREIVLESSSDFHSKLSVPSGGFHHQYFDLAVKLASAFSIYDANPRSETVIPAYTSVCLGELDCRFIEKHIDVVYEFGVGYFVWTLNTKDAGPIELGRLLERAFPSRFILITSDRRLGLAEVWNRYNDMFFHRIDDPLPWYLNANADFWPYNQPLEKFFDYMQEKLRNDANHTLITFGAFSYFVHTYRAHIVLGDFDEAVFPAYCEDTEMYFRARSMGLYFKACTYWANSTDYFHVREISLTDKRVREMFRRWHSNKFLRDKYNVHLRYPNWEETDESLMFKSPFNLSCVPLRSSFVVDPAHRNCILTGRGDFDDEGRCVYDAASHVKYLMPKSREDLLKP